MARLFIAAILALALAVAASAATTITVKRQVSVKAMEMIKLGDIAQVSGAQSDVDRLKQVEIARAAAPGSSRQVTPDWIRNRLSCAGFDPKPMIINAPKAIVLQSASQTVKGADVVEAARQYVSGQLPQDGLIYTVTATGFQADSPAPTGQLEYVAEPVSHAIRPGRLFVWVDVTVDGTVYTRKSISLSVVASGLVLVATQPIGAKEPLTSANTKLEQRDLSNTSAGYVTVAPEDGAKAASKLIASGTIITPDMLAVRPVVTKGDPVIVMVKSGAVKVVVKGTASQDGVVGQSIRVSIPTSKEEIQATVAQAGLVEVKVR